MGVGVVMRYGEMWVGWGGSVGCVWVGVRV